MVEGGSRNRNKMTTKKVRSRGDLENPRFVVKKKNRTEKSEKGH